MAKIIVNGEHSSAEVWDDSLDPEGEPHYVYRCTCGETDTDRGDLADTIEAADVHVTFQCPRIK